MAKNDVVSATLVSGWTVDSSSTSTNLLLDGPDGLSITLGSEQVAAGTTLSDVFEKQFQNFESNSNFTGVEVCQQPESDDLPGTPSLSGGFAAVCFTFTPQGATAAQFYGFIWDALVSAQGSSNLGQMTELAFVPQSTSNAIVDEELKPVLQSTHWLQVSSS